MQQRIDGIDNVVYYIGKCNLSKKNKNISLKNPHCIEYFCNHNNINNCTKCHQQLTNRKIDLYKIDNYRKDLLSASDKTCKKECNSGYIYNIFETDGYKSNTYNIDKLKTPDRFKVNDFIHTYNDVPYLVDYENTYPKPKSVIHWGQLKMLLVTLIFFIKVIEENDKEVHVIYAGSARGDNIIFLSKMFPNVKWYLIDPRDHNKELYKHENIVEITTAYFTDDIAKKYAEKFKNRKHKLLFMSDIREETDDDKIIDNQKSNANWHNIIKPDYSYLKFRCPYEKEQLYKYYDGTIYLQIYAPQSSTETRILFKKDLTEKIYNINEYQGKMIYFNRIIRPGYHKSLIHENNKYDHCYDCVYFGYVLKNYMSKFTRFKKDVFDSDDIYSAMNIITKFLEKYSFNKITQINKYIRNNIIQ